jgi:putative alpha-1,2-mannosidase
METKHSFRAYSWSQDVTRHSRWPLWACLLLAGLPLLGASAPQTHLSDYVRPFVGTKGEGNTYPGPSAPFGMIQLSPDTDRDLWDTASG